MRTQLLRRLLAALAAPLMAVVFPFLSHAADPTPLFTREDVPLLDIPLDFPGLTQSAPVVAIRVVSANTSLFPTNSVVVSRLGARRVVDFYPAKDQSGVADVSITAREGTLDPVVVAFRVTVDPVNDAPTIDPIPGQVWYEGGSQPAILFTVRDPDNDSVRVAVQSIRPARLETSLLPATIVSAGVRTWMARITTPNLAAGSYSLEIQAADNGATNRANLDIVVRPRRFVPVSAGGAGINGSRLDLVDLFIDGIADGYPELLAPPADASSRPPQVMRNTLGRFSGQFASAGIYPDAMAWDDFDGDGRPDVVSASQSRQQLQFWTVRPGALGLGLVSSNSVPVQQDPTLLAGDFDGDGDRDVVLVNGVARSPNPGIWLARNRGDGSFDLERIGDATASGTAAMGDVDDDGDLDFVTTAPNALGQNTVVFWINDGHGRFTRTQPAVPAGGYVSLGLADFDGDGHLDLWLAEQSTRTGIVTNASRVSVLPWSPGGYHTSWSVTSQTNVFGRSTAVVADFNGDGLPDLIGPAQMGSQSGWFYFENAGDATFRPDGFLAASQTSPQPAVGDINGDSRPDVVLGIDFGGGNPSPVMTNAIPSFGLPPPVPTNLRARIDGTRLTLEWDAPFDPFQLAAPTYNVRAGFGPGSSGIVSPLSQPNGRRLAIRPGNAGFQRRLEVDLAGREGDAVFWSVQAVDAGGLASAFAAEQFLPVGLGGSPPVITGLSDFVGVEDTVAYQVFQVTDNGTPPGGLVVRAVADPNNILQSVSVTQAPSPGRALIAIPRADANGSVGISVIATDAAGYSTTNRVMLTIRPINDPPVWEAARDRISFAGEALVPIRVEVSDTETPIAGLTFRATSSSQSMLPDDLLEVRAVGPTTVEVTAPKANAPVGTLTLDLAVTDPEGLTGHAQCTVTFRPRILPEIARFAVPAGLSGLSLGDFDGDGRLDLLGVGGGQALLWQNAADGKWAQVGVPVPAGFVVDHAVWNDWDHDGRLDVVCVGRTPAVQGERLMVVVVSNLDTVPATGPVLDVPSGPAFFATLADVDDDGLLDVVLNGAGPTGQPFLLAALRRGTGFAPAEIALPGLGDVHVLDIDLDGRTDLYASGVPYSRASRSGDTWSVAALGWRLAGPSVLADLDRDGRWDAIVADGIQSVSSRQFLHAVERPTLTVNSPFNAAAVHQLVDLDADGFDDALVRLETGHLALRSWTGGFWDAARLLLPDPVRSVAVGDVDGDGRPDLVMVADRQDPVATPGSSVVVLRNTLAVPPTTPPPAPADVAVSVQADGSFVEWTPRPQDAARGVTHNVRVGTTPGGSDILPPLSLPTGKRLVSGPGNAGISPRRRVTGLEAGRTYYAAVQAVDASGNGGPFSGEVAFTPRATPLSLNGPRFIDIAADQEDLVVAFGAKNAVGTVTARARFFPPELSGGRPPEVRVEGAVVTITVPLRPGTRGRGTLDLRVDDAGGSAALQSVAVTRGDVPQDIDLVFDRPLTTLRDQAVPLGFTVLDPAGTWTLREVSTPANGNLLVDYPSGSYVPAPGHTGPDSFNVSLTTPDGLRVVEQFRVETFNHRGLEVAASKKGELALLVRALPGTSGSVERSSDLVHWEPVGRYAVPANGQLLVESVGSTAEGTAFYRVVPDRP